MSGEHLAYRKKGRWKKDLATAWPFTGPNQNLWRDESRERLLQPDAPPEYLQTCFQHQLWTQHFIHGRHANHQWYLSLSHTKFKEVDHSFTQHVFIEHLLCARQCSRLVEGGKNRVDNGPGLCGLWNPKDAMIVIWGKCWGENKDGTVAVKMRGKWQGKASLDEDSLWGIVGNSWDLKLGGHVHSSRTHR